MKYLRYNKYEKIKLELVKEKPINWTIFKLKYLVRLINKKVTSNEVDYPYIGLENIQSWKGKLYKDIIEYNPDGASNSFQKEDVLFGKLRPYLAKAFIANFDGLCSSELLVLRGKKIYNKYLLYFLLSKNFISVVDSSTYGSKMPRANWTFIGNLKLILPPFPEQKSIAHFLDRETTRIDTLIEKKKKLIELLKEKRTALITRAVTKSLDPNVKMKDSGIEWLGEIPEHWENWKLSHGFNIIGSGTTPKSDSYDYYESGEIPWVTTSELREKIIYDTNKKLTSKAVSDYKNLKKYPKGTLLIAMYGATIGRIGILGIEATVNQACCAFANSNIFNNRFVYYWFQMARPILISMSYGGGQPNLSQDMLRKIIIPIPSIDEQKKIASILDNETNKIVKLISKIEQAITKHQEYRTALISAAVNGKIKVSSDEE